MFRVVFHAVLQISDPSPVALASTVTIDVSSYLHTQSEYPENVAHGRS